MKRKNPKLLVVSEDVVIYTYINVTVYQLGFLFSLIHFFQTQMSSQGRVQIINKSNNKSNSDSAIVKS